MEFHHIGIFVKDLDFGMSELSKFISIASIGEQIEDEGIGVKIIFVKDASNIIYELVAPHGNNSPVTGVLSRDKDFLNHLAYMSIDFDADLKKLRSQGMVPLGAAKKAEAFQGARVIFFLSALGFIIELVEKKESHDR